MSIGNTILHWIQDEERTLGYVARKANLAIDDLIAIVAGDVAPSSDQVSALALATGLTEEQLQEACTSADPDDRQVDPLECFTPKEVAKLLRVSTDTVYRELNEGVLQHVVFGERVKRIPRQALEQRLTQVGGAV